MNRILSLSLLGGVLVVGAHSSGAEPGRAPAGRQPRVSHVRWIGWTRTATGSIDIVDLFTVIDLYFSGDPIPAPSVGGDNKWVRSSYTSTADGLGLTNSVEDDPIYGPWYLYLACELGR